MHVGRPDVPAQRTKLAAVLHDCMEQGQPEQQSAPLSRLRTLVQVRLSEAGVGAQHVSFQSLQAQPQD